MSLLTSMEQLRSDRALLESIIEKNALDAVFQPVRALDDGTLVGYQAIARGPLGSNLESPSGLLSSAQATGYVERLDWMFRCSAFDVAAEAGLDVDLYVTPELETFGSPCPPRLAASLARARRQLHVVAAIAARAFDAPHRLRTGVEEFRGYGWRIAVADVADRTDALDVLAVLRPDALYLDLSKPGRTSGAGADEQVTALVSWAHESGVVLLADNVDTEVRRAEARALGAKAGCGRLLGLPAPLA